MTDPRTILGQARQGPVPTNWRVFTKKRGKLSGFLGGSSHDPDPLLVITSDGAIEYTNERKPLTVVIFDDLAGITLQVHGSSFSDSTIVTLQVWIDLHYGDGGKQSGDPRPSRTTCRRFSTSSKRTAPTRHFEDARRATRWPLARIQRLRGESESPELLTNLEQTVVFGCAQGVRCKWRG